MILDLKPGSKVFLRPVGNINDNTLKKIIATMNSMSKEIDFIMNKNKYQDKKNVSQILILEKGNINKKELVDIKKRLTFSSDKPLGWILIK